MADQKLIGQVTYVPRSGLFIEGYHEQMPNTPTLLASSHMIKGKDEAGEVSYTAKTNAIHPAIKALTATIAAQKIPIGYGSLTAADFEAQRAELNNLILIQLHNQLMGDQMRWFHLDNAFVPMQMDSLLKRISFRDNPAAAQDVARREEYNTAIVKYDEIQFDLGKTVVSWDMPIEDPLRALISPITPLQQTTQWSLAYKREKNAAAALTQIGNYYDRTTKTFGHAKGDIITAKKLPNPDDLTGGTDQDGFHSKDRTVNRIQEAKNIFLKTEDMPLSHFICSPKTAMAIAQNTWTDNNTINNVEMYRTDGGVRAFPGIANTTMVISLAVPDNVLYAVNKASHILVKAEGPKMTKSWEDHSRWTTQTATADFYQYKCAAPELTNIDRKFGATFLIDDTEP